MMNTPTESEYAAALTTLLNAAATIQAWHEAQADDKTLGKHRLQDRLIASQITYHARYLTDTLREKDKR